MNPLRLLWSFYGRIGRLEFLSGLLLNLALAVAARAALAHFAAELPPHQPGEPPDPTIALATLPAVASFIWASLALMVKRFHDIGKTGWFSVVLIVPLFGLIAIIFLLVARGDDYDNAYGPTRSAASLPPPIRL